MFGIDSSEFLLIAVVALLVIGPKDLPRVMRLVGGWVGRGRAMTRHLRSGFDTMMREAEIEEMQKQWARQNADIMAATATAPVGPHSYDAPAGPHGYDPPPHAADAVVGEHVYDHPGALPAVIDDGAGPAVAPAILMTGVQPPRPQSARPAEPASPEPAPTAQP
jgi:sec-independent protein translocase protein TatB